MKNYRIKILAYAALILALVAGGRGVSYAANPSTITMCSPFGSSQGNTTVLIGISSYLTNSVGCITYNLSTDTGLVNYKQLNQQGWLPESSGANNFGVVAGCSSLTNGTTKFTPNPLYTYYNVIMWGGSGGGGGGYTATYSGAGGGGSSACESLAKLTSTSGETIAIGAAGTAGAGGSSPTAGVAGGNTTFTAATGDYIQCTVAPGGTAGGAATSGANGTAGGAATAPTLSQTAYGFYSATASIYSVTGANGSNGSGATAGAGGTYYAPGGIGGSDAGGNGAAGAAGGMLICPLR